MIVGQQSLRGLRRLGLLLVCAVCWAACDDDTDKDRCAAIATCLAAETTYESEAECEADASAECVALL